MRGQRGITLIELLVTLGVIAVLAAISTLASQPLMNSYRVRAAARQVVSDFQFARLSAVKEGRNWTVCFAPGEPAVTSYIVTNDPGACATANAPFYVRTTDLTAFSGVTASENFAGTSVTFGARGTASPLPGNVTLRSLDGARTIAVTLGASGNPRIQ